jgi:hypothetical protein
MNISACFTEKANDSDNNQKQFEADNSENKILSVRLVHRSVPQFLFLATLMMSGCASNSVRQGEAQEEAWRREEAIDAQRDLTRFHRRSSSALGQSRLNY